MLSGKTILILSPQSWGTMFLSKHHYAVALAEAGNRVFFLNPPGDPLPDQGKRFVLRPAEAHAGLQLVSHRLPFPYDLKFHLPKLFHLLMRVHLRQLLRITGAIDIVWSFDLGNLYPLDAFGSKALRVFHPVDEPLNEAAIRSAKGAQIMFSVTGEILGKYDHPVPKHHIHHGVAEYFFNDKSAPEQTGKIRVGMSGNMLRGDIDRDILLQIVKEHPEAEFHCWGSYKAKQTNLSGGEDRDTAAFIEALAAQPNFRFHGPLEARRLAEALHGMDAFLICYDVQKDQSKGTNYHKIMEYLSTGKVVVSNNVTTFSNQETLMTMAPEREHNRSLPALFTEVIRHLDDHNSPDKQAIHIAFARSNTYAKQVSRIGELMAREFQQK